ncbi:maleylpyruvate isomerase family mycothiol-dependent enzyme [Streptomyces marincola]|uniref:Mycothiol-dependent maleylpyruvate isomerase metal-binding domain-containing protein n=1 Tax=Streptomyces marincola TaxID=2878388 RepID=A0A1W7D4W6_9ACTN|nr:maleylpyruvate isomerase family mycothiol-dependent enzyme [Streptomyces marincola]ARQ72054.1 hypothetical protein CAG99_27360 [Streptomyces marincola]
METNLLLGQLRAEGLALAAAALRAGPDAAVPTCPGWRVRDLVLHTGSVHRWAAEYLTAGHVERRPLPEHRVRDGELDAWFRAGHDALLAAFAAAPEDLECLTFLAGSPSARHFWARRQAHETAVHRMDAERAAGVPLSPVPAAFAADGVDELLTGFHSRSRSRLRRAVPAVLRVRATDRVGDDWVVRVSGEAPRGERVAGAVAADCEFAGPVEVLYPALWNRSAWGPEVKVTGDRSVAALWAEAGGV